VDPYDAVAKFLYPGYEYDENTLWGGIKYRKITDESYKKQKERNALYTPLREAAKTWIKTLMGQGIITSSVDQYVKSGTMASVDEMLAEIAGNRFLVPQGMFTKEQLSAMEQIMKDRYGDKEFPGILEYQ
jgi:hypothetical protein